MRWPSTWAFFLLKQNQGPGVVDDDDVDLDNDLKRFDHLPPLARPSLDSRVGSRGEGESWKKCEKSAKHRQAHFTCFALLTWREWEFSIISTTSTTNRVASRVRRLQLFVCACRASTWLTLAVSQPVQVDRGSSVAKNRVIGRVKTERRR